MDGDFGERRVDWLEAPPQLFKIGPPARVDLGGERCRQSMQAKTTAPGSA